MNAKRNTVGWGFFLIWALATLVGIVVAFFVFFVAMAALGESIGIIPMPVASLIMTGCFGFVIGLAQWSILRSHVPQPAIWIGITLLGFLISSPALLSWSGGFGPYITSRASLGMAAALGSSLGITQWLVLRNKVARAALWIGISLISWIVAGLIGLALKSLSWEMGPILYWLGLFFAGTVLSAIGMVWLFRKSTPPANMQAA